VEDGAPMPLPRRLPGGLLRVRAERHHALYVVQLSFVGTHYFPLTAWGHPPEQGNRQWPQTSSVKSKQDSRSSTREISQSFGLASVAKLDQNSRLTPLQLLQHDRAFRSRSGSTACSVGVPPLLLLVVGYGRSK
jgi:hypothetical protein